MEKEIVKTAPYRRSSGINLAKPSVENILEMKNQIVVKEEEDQIVVKEVKDISTVEANVKEKNVGSDSDQAVHKSSNTSIVENILENIQKSSESNNSSTAVPINVKMGVEEAKENDGRRFKFRSAFPIGSFSGFGNLKTSESQEANYILNMNLEEVAGGTAIDSDVDYMLFSKLSTSRQTKRKRKTFSKMGCNIKPIDNIPNPFVRIAGSTNLKYKTIKSLESDNTFDNMKLLSQVSSEVPNTHVLGIKTDSDQSTSVDVVSEVSTPRSTSSTDSEQSNRSQRILKRKGTPYPHVQSKKSFIDVLSPIYRKPFEFGWKRELVYRKGQESSTAKRMADVYYYTPTGKKVRSNREVSEYLEGGDLTLEHFTFSKDSLGINDPDKEIIRDAKQNVIKEPSPHKNKATPKVKPKKVAKVAEGASSPTPQLSQGPSNSGTQPSQGPSKPVPQGPSKPVSQGPSKPGSQGHSKPGSQGSPNGISGDLPSRPPRNFPKIKVVPNKQLRQKVTRQKQPNKSDELEMGMLPPTWTANDAFVSPRSSRKVLLVSKKAATSGSAASTVLEVSSPPTTPNKKKLNEPCSVQCLGVMSVIPSLQCRACLCLFHPECVGLGGYIHESLVHCYTCQNCQKNVKPSKSSLSALMASKSNMELFDISANTPLPPLTPISALTAPKLRQGCELSPTTTSLPKLQRLPRPGELGKFITVPRYMKAPKKVSPHGQSGANKGSIVGAVTTWLPHSSTVQLNSTNTCSVNLSPKPSTVVSSGMSSSSTPLAEQVTSSSNPVPNQSLLRINGKRYIVVPKQNIVSVSPVVVDAVTSMFGENNRHTTYVGDKCSNSPSSSMILMSNAPHTASEKSHTSLQQPQIVTSSVGSRNPSPNYAQGTCMSSQSFLQRGASSLVGCGSSGFTNPPGVLLFPFVTSGPSFTPTTVSSNLIGIVNKASEQHGFVNGPVGSMQNDNYFLTGFHQQGHILNGHKKQLENAAQSGPMANLFGYTSTGYTALIQVFEYLKVKELLRASRVCRMWRDLANNKSMWHTVRLKNTAVYDWSHCASFLKAHSCHTLDMRKMLIHPEDEEGIDNMWHTFCRNIGRIETLRRVEVCRCPAVVVERIAETCSNMNSVIAMSIICESIDLTGFIECKYAIEEIRLRSLNGIHISDGLRNLFCLETLVHLSLTSFKNLGPEICQGLGELTQLETLELGDCDDFPEDFGTKCLIKLKCLQKLRLEKGHGRCPLMNILDAIKHIDSLAQLELINFDIGMGFMEALELCTNLRRFLIIPTYIAKSANTNRMILRGISKLKNSLTHFMWGITHELIRVTQLFIGTCDDDKIPEEMKSSHNYVPVLKSTNDCDDDSDSDNSEGEWFVGGTFPKFDESTPDVRIVSIHELEKKLKKLLPGTNVTILKVPHSATWRQSMSEIQHQ